MFSSKLPNDELYDNYIDTTAYDTTAYDTSHDPVFSTLEAYRAPSSHAAPHYAPHFPHTNAQEISQTFSGLNSWASESGPIYLAEQVGFDTELQTTFRDIHAEEPLTEEHQFGRYQALVSEHMDDNMYPFPRTEVSGGACYDGGISTNAVNQFDDFATIQSTSQSHHTSSKKSLSCEHCGKNFNLQHDRRRHLRTLHRQQENPVYRCAVPGCAKGDKMFNRLDNFKKHLKTRHGNESSNEMVRKSRTQSGDTFTVTTPEMYSCSS